MRAQIEQVSKNVNACLDAGGGTANPDFLMQIEALAAVQ